MIIVGGLLAAGVVAGVSSLRGGGDAGNRVRVWDPAHGHYHDATGRQVP
jgi:hypothetical protein